MSITEVLTSPQPDRPLAPAVPDDKKDPFERTGEVMRRLSRPISDEDGAGYERAVSKRSESALAPAGETGREAVPVAAVTELTVLVLPAYLCATRHRR